MRSWFTTCSVPGFQSPHREAIKHPSDGVPVYSTPRSGATRGPSGALIVQWRCVSAASARCRATPARCEHRRTRSNIGVASSLVTFFWRRRRKLLPPRHERLPRGAATLVTRPSFPALRRRWIVAGCAVIRLPLHCTVCHSIFSISFLLNAFLHRAWRVISWNVSFMENSLRPPVYWRS